jgi:hypothetical protein
MIPVFSFQFDGDNYWITTARHVQFGMQIEQKHTATLRLAYTIDCEMLVRSAKWHTPEKLILLIQWEFIIMNDGLWRPMADGEKAAIQWYIPSGWPKSHWTPVPLNSVRDLTEDGNDQADVSCHWMPCFVMDECDMNWLRPIKLYKLLDWNWSSYPRYAEIYSVSYPN